MPPANRLHPAVPDRDLAEFRAGFDAGDEEAAAKLEASEPDAKPKSGRRKKEPVA